LGYSDYQGDETQALYIPSQGQSLTSFILNKRAAEWVMHNKPIKVFQYKTKVLAKIYYMPELWRNDLKTRDKLTD
jgi:hypothetical protein